MRKKECERRLNEIFALPPSKQETALKKLAHELTAAKEDSCAHEVSFHLAAHYYENEKPLRAKHILVPIVSNYAKFPFIPRYVNMFMLLGLIELGEENYTLASYYFTSGLKLAKIHRLPRATCLAYSNLAIVDSALGYNEKALENLLMAEKYLDTTGEGQHVLVYMNLAVCYKFLGQLEASEASLLKCINEYHGMESARRPLIQCCAMDLYRKLGNQTKYEAYKNQIIQECTEQPNPDRLQAYQMICENALREQDNDLALLMLERLKGCIIGKDDKATELFIAQSEGELARQRGDKDAVIASLEKQLTLNRELSEITSQRLIRNTGVEIRMSQLMRANENAKREREKDRRNRLILTDALNTAKEASEAKGAFMSKMSHEIRTPLNAIMGYLSIAREMSGDREKTEYYLDQTEVAAHHLLDIVNDVLDISSIESGRMKIDSADFDMAEMIHSLTTIFYTQAKAKNVRFKVEISDLTEEWVRGDSMRVKQILLNLLSNAVKFTPAGGRITLGVRQMNILGDKVHLQFTVQDTGIGMSEAYLSRIFTPFEQESASTARQYGGSGLGLSISQNLINMMGGSIAVNSKQGEGTTFAVSLPFGKCARNERYQAQSFPQLRALVVSEEESTCSYVQMLLRTFGMRCDTASSEKRALRRAESRLTAGTPYDLYVLDWDMDEHRGEETAQALRDLNGDVPAVILAAAYDSAAVLEEDGKAAVDHVVGKPLFLSSICETLVATFDKTQATEKKETTDAADFSGMPVLLAEDNAMNREIALHILQKAGLVITAVEDGKQALDTFTASEAGTFRAILMDVQMPVMDGYESTRQIRQSAHPDAKTIPIIAMTANAFTADVNAALAAGMNSHIAKPIDYKRFFRILAELTKTETHEGERNDG